MFERYTDGARQVVVLSGEEAKRLGHAHIGTEHILLALRREGEDAGAQVLRRSGVEFADVRQQIRQLMRRSLPLYSLGRTPHSRRLSPRCQRVPTSAKPAALSASTWVASWLDSVPWWPAST